LRSINGTRGIETFAEAHADGAAKQRGIAISYEWRLHQNGTTADLFAIHDDILFVDTNPFEDCPCGEVVRRCIRVAFIWAPKFNDQLSMIHFVTAWKSDLVSVEPGNRDFLMLYSYVGLRCNGTDILEATGPFRLAHPFIIIF
jgi:hypothetical protein